MRSIKLATSLATIITILLTLSACGDGKGNVNGDSLTTIGDPTPKLSQSNEPLNILIFGGSSGIGLETTRLALERGHNVTSITRRPERMPIEHKNLANLKGDITKPETYSQQFNGQNIIISSIGLGSREPTTVYSGGMQSVLQAMQEAEVQRVISITGIGAGDSKGHGGFFYDRILNPLMLKEDYKDKTRQEQILRNSSAKWTIVRPGFLTNEQSEQTYRVIQDMQGFTSGDVARADVAHFLTALAEQGSYINKTVFLSK
ncbi:MAG: putative NADH-flavin reductase [Cryomorphaceae bacterium]|jgi:putative NADH-flavin reductase